MIGLLLGPAVLLLAAHSVPALDPIFESPRFHLLVVSAIAGCALLLAFATAVAAAKDGRAAPVLLAIGCVCVGSLMLAHGLTTPGMLGQPMNMWVSRFASLALIGFAVCLAAAAWDQGPIARIAARAPRLALGASIVVLAVGSIVIVVDPTVLSGTQPFPAEDFLRSLILGASSMSLLVTGCGDVLSSVCEGRVNMAYQIAARDSVWLSRNVSCSFGASFRL